MDGAGIVGGEKEDVRKARKRVRKEGRKEGERTGRAVQYFERDAPREAGNAQLRPGTPGAVPVIVFVIVMCACR